MAITGRGRAPFISSWWRKTTSLRHGLASIVRQIQWGDTDSADQTIKTDYFFDATPPLSTAFGINFRATSGYVTDGADETYCIGDSYPVTRAGRTFGWVSTVGDMTRDRDSALDRRLAGQNQKLNNGTQIEWQLDGFDPAKTYTVRLALGDGTSNQGYTYGQIKDGSNVRATIATGTDLVAPEFVDAGGTIRSPAAWVSSNTAITGGVFASGALTLLLGSPTAQADSSTIAHIDIAEEASGGSTVKQFAAMGVG